MIHFQYRTFLCIEFDTFASDYRGFDKGKQYIRFCKLNSRDSAQSILTLK